ncbi:MAG: fluoride efflux transporter CrcB [Paracoccus sp. (in: a-proteobacteria)]|nr:fluoride efflux transporter CrcB [Paracoccus sp. (in: a-proteobacteria)]
MIYPVIQVALGSAIGGVARYAVGQAVARGFGPGFPLATLMVNVIGSFAIGLIGVALAARGAQGLAPFLMVGLLGGFTTFSAFSLDALTLLEGGRMGMAFFYIGASVLLSLLAAAAGLALGRGIFA